MIAMWRMPTGAKAFGLMLVIVLSTLNYFTREVVSKQLGIAFTSLNWKECQTGKQHLFIGINEVLLESEEKL
jgi:hypothetical protein